MKELTTNAEVTLNKHINKMIDNRQLFVDDIIYNIINYALETYTNDIERQLAFIRAMTEIDENELIKIINSSERV